MPSFIARLKQLVSVHATSLLLLCVVFVIGLGTIQPGKLLLGWDVTAPELNLGLNLERAVFGVWQTYRGLGTLDGMAHTANIIHVLWMAVWKTVVGLELARPTWLLTLYAIGMIGAAALARTVITRAFSPVSKKIVECSALITGLLYGLNLYSLQMWYAPLEVFAYQFAVLPWLLWSLLRYLRTQSARSLLLFGVISLLGLGQAHVPTVFISSSLLLGLVLINHLVAHRNAFKMVLLAGLVYVAINAVWLIPYSYSALNKSVVIASSQINQLSSPEITARNKAWGSMYRVVTMGSFNLDYLDWQDTPDHMAYMIGKWRSQYFSWWYQVASVMLFVSALGGAVVCLRGKRWRSNPILWLPVAFAAFFALLANNSLLFGWITAGLTRFVPLFGEVFRFTFTKFSQPYALVLSLLVGVALAATLHWLAKQGRTISTHIAVVAGFILLIGIQSFPVWSNGLFYTRLWVTVPESYFQLSTYLNTHVQSWEKIAVLPSPTLYGWTSNTWGHRGSGFLWQMVRPALLDRAFDAWSTENETYYQQLATAITGQDATAFFTVLKKYQVPYILFDASITAGSEELQTLEQEAVREWLTTYAQPVFQNGDLTLYYIDGLAADSPMLLVENPLVVRDGMSRSQEADSTLPYVATVNPSQLTANSTFHPFNSIDQEKLDLEQLRLENGALSLALPRSAQDTRFVLPVPAAGTPLTLPFTVTYSENQLTFQGETLGSVTIGGKTTTLQNPLLFTHSVDVSDIDATMIMADINGQLVTVETNQQQTIWLNRLKMHEPIVIRTFLPEHTEDEGEQLVVTGDVAESMISSTVWDSWNEVSVAIPADSPTIDTVTLRTYTSALSLTNGAPVENCDALERGSVAEGSTADRVTISARGFANACKGFPLAPASSHDSFFVDIMTKTNAENGLLMGVQHWSTPNAIVYQLLGKQSNRLLLSVPGVPLLPEKNSSLLLENRSFSNRENTAEIQAISVSMPAYSVEYLKTIRLDSVAANGAALAANSNESVLPSLRLQPTYFQVTRNPDTETSTDLSALTFLQAYDSGWLAFPSLQPWKRLEHVKYNGWANAWIIPTADNNSTDTANAITTQRITIMYWPQLLTFVGFGVLLTTLIGLGWLAWYERPNSDSESEYTVTDRSRELSAKIRDRLTR